MKSLFALLLLAGLARAAEPFDGFDAYVARCLKAHGVPGIGVAVVQDGKVILAKGYGVKEVGQDEPVTENSLFAIGSVSKSFTAAMVAMLVDEKKMAWDNPLRMHLPDFRTAERSLNDEILIRDCLAHRAGLARHELLWYGAPFDRAEVLRRVSKLKPTVAPRTRFMYNNILYLAAGEAAAKAAGKSWDTFISERLFKPLGMKTATTSITKFTDETDLATPHTKVKGKPVKVAWRNADNIGPAGSINASAAEMAEYVKFQLAKGKAGDKRLIQKETFQEMHSPQILMGKPQISLNPDSRFQSYGLGWMLHDFRGSTLVEHGGNIDGMSAGVLLLPEKKIGVVVLANLNASLLPEALGMDILDRLLGQENQELAFRFSYLAFASEMGLQTLTEPDAAKREKDTKPTYPLEKYVGKYQDDTYAPVRVSLKDGKLTGEFNTFGFGLEHWHHDTFVGADRTHTLPKMLFTFDQAPNGGIAAIRFTPLMGEEFRFKKVSDKEKR